MLQIVYGRIGSGKTGYIYNEIAKEIENGNDRLFLIVPEQYTFVTERELSNRIDPTKLDNVDITSFSRLAIKLVKNSSQKKKLDDCGRTMLMNMAMDAVSDKLEIYSGHNKNISIVSEMISLVGELKKSAITSAQLNDVCSEIKNDTLRKKVSETAIVMEMYEALLHRDYIDSGDELDKLYDVLGELRYFENCKVFVDAFHGFSGQELKLLERIFEQSENCFVTLTTDDLFQREYDFGPFAYSKTSAKKLMDTAKKSFVKIAEPIHCNADGFYSDKALRQLEKEMYKTEPVPYDDKSENITVCAAGDIREECVFVAQQIKKLLRCENYRCRDITVITRSMDTYCEEMQYQLEKYDIPHFRDERVSISKQPLILFVKYALAIAVEGFSEEKVMGYLKTGLTGIDIESISEFENYVLMWGISGSQFRNDFTRHPEGYGTEFYEADKIRLEKINAARRKVVGPLIKLRENLESPDGESAAKAIYELLITVGASDNLKKLADELEEIGELTSARQQARIWDVLIEILDNFAGILKGMRLTQKRVYELFNASVRSIDIGNIPQGLDEVSIGDAARIRIDAPKAVFVLGANEGVFPMIVKNNSTFNDNDRNKLCELGLDITKSRDNRADEERFVAYYAVCCATDKVFVTYSKNSDSGETLTESEIVSQIKKIVPNCRFADAAQTDTLDYCEGLKPAFEITASRLKDKTVESNSLRAFFKGTDSWNEKLEVFEKLNDSKMYEIKDKKASVELFGKDMYMSASRAEVYEECPFKYFLRYGIKAKPRGKAELDPLQTGTVIHYVLENVLKDNNIEDFINFSNEKLRKKAEEILDEYFSEKMGGEENPKRFSYLFLRLKKIVTLILERLQSEFRTSNFVPTGFEVRIANDGEIKPYEIELENGGILRLNGSVDRVDTFEKDGKTYIRVIDYKTGGKQFSLSHVLNGLQMQMLLYMFAIQKNGRGKYEGVIPAGVLYYPAGVEFIKSVSSSADDEKIKKEHIKNGKMSGVILEDEEIAKAMETDLGGNFIPVKLKKEELVGDLLTLEELGVLNTKIDEILCEMANALHNGKVEAVPVSGKGYYKDICKYCDYHTVCGHSKDDEVRALPGEKLEVARLKLGGEDS